MKLIRRYLHKKLGLEGYLRFVSKWYIRLVDNGFLKKKHPEIHYLKNIIQEGDVCIDIGANLGYYSYFMSILTGSRGKVYAVEPIPLFRDIWEVNVKKTGKRNIEMLPYALGESERTVKMGMPSRDGVIHHGMTKIAEDKKKEFSEYFEAEMKIPDNLFAELEQIDFIKIDIEGYEYPTLTNMMKTIRRHHPRLQIELSKDRDKIFPLLEAENYIPHILVKGILIPAGRDAKNYHKRDFYFIPKSVF
ncbi:MAG: FkbM family methyltransferase [Bacteroidales bacterium]